MIILLISADNVLRKIRHAWTIGACYRFIENALTILEADMEYEPQEGGSDEDYM